MNFKRMLCLLLAALMLVGTLAACGGDPEGTSDGTETAAPVESGPESGEETGEEPATTPETGEPVTPGTEGSEGPVETEEPATETEGTVTEPEATTNGGTTTEKPPATSGSTTAKPPEPPKTTTPEKDPYEEIPVDNTAIKAPNEDASLRLWFDHAFGKTAETNTTSTGRNTYKMYMGKNEIEDCQFYLSANSDKTGLTAEITPFKDKSGHSITAELFFFVYFNVGGPVEPDAIPPYNGDAFTVKANTSKGFLIKVKTTATTAAGEYEATLNIKNSAGQIVKTAKVYLKVWNFTLAEASACRTAMDLGWYEIYAGLINLTGDNKWAAGDDGVTYVKYYEYLLENRVSAYSLPYDGGNIFDSRNEKYMNDPRVTAFNVLGWKGAVTNDRVKAAYEKLSANPEWFKKGYFYKVDEPMTMEQLEELRGVARVLKNFYPGYKLMAPFEFATIIDPDNNLYDYIDYMAEDITLWCPKSFCFATAAEMRGIKSSDPMMSAAQERRKGTFWDRMKNEVKGGDELWWYVSCLPTEPFVTMTIEASRLAERQLFWQQKLYGVDGFLYFAVNAWSGNSWTPRKDDIYGVNIYGDGQLVYLGQKYGVDGPIGCLRLEAVRDGIEDYEYFHMLEQKVGNAKVIELISKVTTSVVKYTDDADLFAAQRVYVGNYLESLSK